MQQRERLPDFRIARAGQPAGLLGRQFRDVAPERFDEEQFGELRQHGLSAGARGIGLLDRETNGILQPLPRRAVSDIDFEDGWKSRQKHPAQLRIAGHVPTDELRDFASAARASELEALGEDAVQIALLVHGLDLGAVAHNVRVAMGKDDDVAGSERNPVAVL